VGAIMRRPAPIVPGRPGLVSAEMSQLIWLLLYLKQETSYDSTHPMAKGCPRPDYCWRCNGETPLHLDPLSLSFRKIGGT